MGLGLWVWVWVWVRVELGKRAGVWGGGLGLGSNIRVG